MKTDFEELWSYIYHSGHMEWQHRELIRLWYLNNNKLEKIELSQILGKRNNLLEILRGDESEIVEIPVYRIYAVTYEDTIIMNRTKGYQGTADMTIDVEDWK